jgi:hypothetical protein
MIFSDLTSPAEALTERTGRWQSFAQAETGVHFSGSCYSILVKEFGNE